MGFPGQELKISKFNEIVLQHVCYFKIEIFFRLKTFFATGTIDILDRSDMLNMLLNVGKCISKGDSIPGIS